MREKGKNDGASGVVWVCRSVMGDWFKFWNFPDLLRRYAIYLPWPVSYKEYAKDGYRFEYIRIVPPDGGQGGPSYGRETLASLRRQVEGKRYDALFFKFCFVDFRDKRLKDEKTEKGLFEGMRSLVGHVHAFAPGGDASLIPGNALPVLRAGE